MKSTRTVPLWPFVLAPLAACGGDTPSSSGPEVPGPLVSGGAAPAVGIDIQPSPIDLSTTTTLTVYVYATPSFDPVLIAPATVRMVVGGQGSGAPVATRAGGYFTATRDYNGDALVDRMLVFKTSDVKAAGLRGCDPVLRVQDLTGAQPFVGTDPSQPPFLNGVPVASVSVTPALDSIAIAATRAFAATAYDGAAVPILGCTYAWNSTVPSVATVDSVGVATGVSDGTTSVTATTGAVTGSATLVVRPGAPAAKFIVTSSSYNPAPGGTVTISAQVADAASNPLPQAGRTVTWSSTGAGGSFASPTSTTNGSGVATVSFTVSAAAGTIHTVTATEGALTGTSAPIKTGGGQIIVIQP
ncbi:MAG TPA: Ig-like domain-containing protein [Longimicrobium sp.]|nr:Ig-like domain-containing protein [Longimicrobium sp.]